MEIVNAETAFNDLGKRYENAYADNPGLVKMVNDVISRLKPGSRILDVGCGTGKPVSAMLAAAGHSVHGIDVSEEMLKVARSQVPGTFEKQDMLKFQPPHKYNAIFAMYSLYLLTPSESHAIIARFADWLEPDGGILLIAVTPSTSLSGQDIELVEDPIWDCVRAPGNNWWSYQFNSTFAPEHTWGMMVVNSGMGILKESTFEFHPQDDDYKRPETHYLLMGQRYPEWHPLLAPHPHPKFWGPTTDRYDDVWKEYRSRLVFEAGQEKVIDALKNCKKILDIGDGFDCLQKHANEVSAEITKTPIPENGKLPFKANTFDGVFALLTFEHMLDSFVPYLQDIARVLNTKNPHSTVIIIQSLPESESYKLISNICAPISQTRWYAHQGVLLHEAAMKKFPAKGIGQVSLNRILSNLEFGDLQSPEEQYAKAADLLAGIWYQGDPKYGEMKEALMPQLKMLFADHPNIIRSEMVVLIARPTANGTS